MYYAYIRARGEDYKKKEMQRETVSDFARKQKLEISEWFEERVELSVLYEMIGKMKVHGVDTVITCGFDEEVETWQEAPDLAPLVALCLEIRFVDVESMMYGRVAANYDAIIADLRELRAIYDEWKKGEQKVR